MPQLKKSTVQRIVLPSYEEDEDKAWVDLETPAKMSDFQSVDTNLPQIMQSATIITSKIKDWNLVNENNEKLEITAETVASFDAIDFAALSIALGLNKLMALSTQKKSNS